MMNEKELNYLIKLLDDPDENIFKHVEKELLQQGNDIIKRLEDEWEQSFDALVQTRIETLISKINFYNVCQELRIWKLSGTYNLLQGLIIINKYQYPDLEDEVILQGIDEIKREVWLDMIYEMSPSEQVRMINNVLFNKFGFSGNTQNYHDPQNSFIGKVLETKKGNPLLLSCIYSIVAQKLDIPIYGVNLPKHFIVAFTDSTLGEEQDVLFYINPFNRGQIFGKRDVLAFLKQLNMPYDDFFMKPCTNEEILKRLIRNLISSYTQLGNQQKKEEMEELLKILEDA